MGAGVARISLLVDGKEIPSFIPRAVDRVDIVQVFDGIGDRQSRLKSGFLFEIPEALASGKTALLTLRVFNRNFRFRDILNRRVRFLPPTK